MTIERDKARGGGDHEKKAEFRKNVCNKTMEKVCAADGNRLMSMFCKIHG